MLSILEVLDSAVQLPNSRGGHILYSRKLSREKPFTNFTIFQPSAKVFSTKFWACHTHYATSFNIPRKFSPQNAPLLPICESFLLRKFPAIRYMPTVLTPVTGMGSFLDLDRLITPLKEP